MSKNLIFNRLHTKKLHKLEQNFEIGLMNSQNVCSRNSNDTLIGSKNPKKWLFFMFWPKERWTAQNYTARFFYQRGTKSRFFCLDLEVCQNNSKNWKPISNCFSAFRWFSLLQNIGFSVLIDFESALIWSHINEKIRLWYGCQKWWKVMTWSLKWYSWY